MSAVSQDMLPIRKPSCQQCLNNDPLWMIMCRVLKAIAIQGEIGNVMTLANPEVVEQVIEDSKKLGEINFSNNYLISDLDYFISFSFFNKISLNDKF